MERSEFAIGSTFYCDGLLWRCTDIGSRVIVAIRIDSVDVGTTSSNLGKDPEHRSLNRVEAENEGWFEGPPYAVLESVFDEEDQKGCSVEADD